MIRNGIGVSPVAQPKGPDITHTHRPLKGQLNLGEEVKRIFRIAARVVWIDSSTVQGLQHLRRNLEPEEVCCSIPASDNPDVRHAGSNVGSISHVRIEEREPVISVIFRVQILGVAKRVVVLIFKNRLGTEDKPINRVLLHGDLQLISHAVRKPSLALTIGHLNVIRPRGSEFVYQVGVRKGITTPFPKIRGVGGRTGRKNRAHRVVERQHACPAQAVAVLKTIINIKNTLDNAFSRGKHRVRDLEGIEIVFAISGPKNCDVRSRCRGLDIAV